MLNRALMGERLRLVRKSRGLTIAEAAASMGASANFLRKYEEGRIKEKTCIERLDIFCNAYNMPPEYFTDKNYAFVPNAVLSPEYKRGPRLTKRKVRIPIAIPKDCLNYTIDMLNTEESSGCEADELDSRASNPLHRAEINTIGELLDAIESGRITGLKGVGVTAIRKIYNALINFTIQHLEPEKVPKYFLSIVEANHEEAED